LLHPFFTSGTFRTVFASYVYRRLQLATVRSQLHLTESTTESELSHISAMDTPRLHLSIMSPDYLDDFHRIWSNPEATQWR
jgi:hypothetical protein